jgi:DNA-binding response OmpR family regulator
MNEGLGLPRILVADDEPALRELVTVSLGDAAACDEAGDGDDALAKLETADYDLVVLDLMMPGRSGMEVLRAIRADERLRSLPVLVMSAWQSARESDEVLEAGANGFVPKPFKPEELVTAVRDLLEAGA